jgi:hypothetical protein
MDTAKVFIACALGGFVGTMVALQFATHFWWLGLIVGGLVGYLSYEFREVLAALREAWILTTSWRPDLRGFLRRCAENIGYAAKQALGTALLVSNYFPLFTLIMLFSAGKQFLFQNAFLLGGIYVGCMIFFGIMGFLAGLDELGDGRNRDLLFSEGLRFNPFATWFYHIPRAILRALWNTGWGIVHGSIWTVRFVRTFFLLVHSDFRLLCGVDAALGCAVGYFFGNALVGGLAGGVIGLINFEIVSKRILHINPTR